MAGSVSGWFTGLLRWLVRWLVAEPVGESVCATVCVGAWSMCLSVGESVVGLMQWLGCC